jgi:hypothetical protein
LGDFISEDDLLTFEGWLRYQAFDNAPPEELEVLRRLFDELMERRKASPKVGLMKFQPVLGEQKYAVAIRDGSDLSLTLWVRYSRKGEIFVMYPRPDRDWDAHASYHHSGRFHQKFANRPTMIQQRQPLTPAFRGSEHLGLYKAHGKSSGTVCDPNAFDGVVSVEPGILGPKHGAVGVDLVEPGYEPEWDRDDTCQRFYFSGVHQREVSPRNGRLSVVITIHRD